MKKLLTVIASTALLSLSISSKAADTTETDAMVEMIMTMMTQDPAEVKEGSDCFGISEKNFLKAYRKILEICIPKDGLQGNCTDTEAPKQLGISQEKFDKCAGDDEEGTDNTQDNDTDYSDLSEEEAEALMAKQQAEGLAAMEAMLALSKQTSAGTENKITLPVYSPSTITSHYTAGMENSEGKKTLPVATLNTTDSVEKVAAFYKKSLPDFEINEDEGLYWIMKKIPNDLLELSMDLNTLPLYFVPHIAIYSLKVSGKDTTFIVISYEP